MKTALQAIAIKAQSHPRHRFQNVYRLLDKDLLFESWGALNKHSAPGIDNLDCTEYKEDLEGRIENLNRSLLNKSYRANAIKRVYIPKADGKERPLGLPTIEDKLVQHCASQILQSIWEADFEPASFGYRSNRSAHGALEAIRSGLQQGVYGYVVEADIKGFFDRMSHEWLEKMLAQRIEDKAFMSLVKQWLKSNVVEPDGQRYKQREGVPQGGLISPILANIYLHYVLDLWFEKVFKSQLAGEAMLVRYADDFIVAFRYREDARRFYNELPARLQKFDLEVAPEKTRQLRFSRHRPTRKVSFQFLGFSFFWEIANTGKSVVMMRTAKEKQTASIKRIYTWIKYNRSSPVGLIMRRVKKMLQGFVNYFGVPGNAKSITAYQYYTRLALYKWLNRRSQRRSYNWSEFNHLLHCFNVRALRVKPRVFREPALHGRIYN